MFLELAPNRRRALLNGFSHAVYFTFTDDSVTVLAVIHTARDPDYLKDRLESRNGLTDEQANKNDDDIDDNIEDDTQADG